MSHSIPVIYLICAKEELPKDLSSWNCADDLLAHAFANKETSYMQMASGRNWWQLSAINEIIHRDQLDNLNFINEEISVVSPSQVTGVIRSVKHAIDQHDFLIEKFGDCEYETTPLEHIYDIECDVSGGLLAFLQSFLFVLQKAEENNKCFLFVAPPP